MARFVCAFVLSIVLLQPSAGRGQPNSTLTLSDRAQTAVMFYLTDKQLHDELKLSAEQVAQLTAFRDKWTGGKTTATSVAERRKQLSAILNPAQVQRLEQIGLQNLTKSAKGFSSAMIDSIAEALKLSAEQKQQATNRTTLEKVLTPDQRKTWDGFIGQPFLAQLVPQFPGGFGGAGGGGKVGKGGGFGTTDSLLLRRLQVPDLQKELKFNTEQEKKLAEIADKFTKDRAEKLAAAAGRALATAVTKDAHALLTPEQDKRLKQIEAQKSIGPNPIAIFDYAPAKAQLNLAPDHLEQLAAIRKDGEQVLNKIFLSGQTYEKIADAIKQSKQATYNKLVGTLSPEQRETLKNVTGAPYTGAWPTNLPTGFPTKGTGTFAPGPKDRNDAIGRFGVLALPRPLALQALRKELKLAEGQTTVASLTPEQNKRALGLLFQNMDYLAGPMYLFIYKDMADGLNLTADQKAKLGPLAGKAWQDQLNRNSQNTNAAEPLRISEETRREQSAQIGKILTAEQQKQMNALMGVPFADRKTLAQEHYASLRNAKLVPGGFGGGGSFAGTNPQHANLNVVRHELVTKELQITPAQHDRLETLAKLWAEESAKLNAGEPRQGLATKIDAEIAALLSEIQRSRLQQIELQRKSNGATFKTTAILDSAIVGKLKLTPQQTEMLKAHFAEANQTLTLLSRELGTADRVDGTSFGGGKGTAASSEYAKTRTALRESFDSRALAFLTTDQQQSWRDMLGQPFAGIAELANVATTSVAKKRGTGQE